MYDNRIAVDILLSVEHQWKLGNNIIENVSSMLHLTTILKIALLLTIVSRNDIHVGLFILSAMLGTS